MPTNQRARLNWLDRVVLAAATAVLAAAVMFWQQAGELRNEIQQNRVDVRTSRAVSCAGQSVVTGSTVPACQSVAHLAQGR